MRLKFCVREIVKDQFLGGGTLFRIDFDQDNQFAREDFSIVPELSKEAPVRIQSIDAGAKGELWLMSDLGLKIVHADF